jgi:hypothetical protein
MNRTDRFCKKFHLMHRFVSTLIMVFIFISFNSRKKEKRKKQFDLKQILTQQHLEE